MSELTNKFQHWSYHRQCLGKQATSIEQALSAVIGVYSSHPSGPLSLYARVKSFSEQAFYQLDRNRLAFRVPSMRESVYMLPRESAHLAIAATIPPPSDPYWRKRYSNKGRFIPEAHYESWKEEIFRAAGQPTTAAEIKKAVDIPGDSIKPLLNRIAFEGGLLRIGAKSLRSNIISYVSTKAWAGDDFAQVAEDKAIAWLAGEYLRAFGPVRAKDFQWWAGITATKAKAALAAHPTESVDTDYLLLAADLGDFERFKIPSTDSLDILPQWDSYTMGYAPDGRERFVSPDLQHNIYGSIGATGGNALGVILVNGRAYGSWSSRFKGNQMAVTLNMFEKPSNKLHTDITHRFNEIANLLKAKSVVFETK